MRCRACELGLPATSRDPRHAFDGAGCIYLSPRARRERDARSRELRAASVADGDHPYYDTTNEKED